MAVEGECSEGDVFEVGTPREQSSLRSTAHAASYWNSAVSILELLRLDSVETGDADVTRTLI